MGDFNSYFKEGKIQFYTDYPSTSQLGTSSNGYQDWTGTAELCYYERSGADWWTYIDGDFDESGDEDMDWTIDRIDIDGPHQYSSNPAALQRMDWLFVSKFVYPEPAHLGWGTEESKPSDGWGS